MSTVANSRLVHITDDKGRLLLPGDDLTEPNPDSIVLVDGIHGTAWQRFQNGEWYSVRSHQSRTWTELLKMRRLVLVYDAEPRPDHTIAAGREAD